MNDEGEKVRKRQEPNVDVQKETVIFKKRFEYDSCAGG